MKALIAMSGGVDSSVAALLAMEAGYDCIGCTMELLENNIGTGSGQDNGDITDGCGREISDAEAVARRLGIPFYTFDMKDRFRECVIDSFVSEYSAGRTPNPCIVCNRTMKFGALLEKATELGCDKIVTGHYARVCYDEQTGLYQLKKGLDHTKDQSYVLYHLDQRQLSKLLLPLGDLTKKEVRQIASNAGFINADRPESQDICFVPEGRYVEKIREYSGKEFPPGDFVDLDGNVIGTHKGIIHYTIGQHKRLGQAFGVPRYVCGIDADNNRVILGGAEDVFSQAARVSECSWISGSIPEGELRCKVRLRYKQQEQWASVKSACTSGFPAEGNGNVEAVIDFDEPQRAITPGQAAVFYDGDTVLGGGTITGSKAAGTLLLAGGTGFIGSHTAVALMDRGYDVVIIDDLSNSSASVVDRIEKITGKRPVFYDADVRDRSKLDEIFQKHPIDGVIHFAGLKSVRESVSDPLKYYRRNIDTTLALLETMDRYDVNTFVFSSSANVYGSNNPCPFTESMETGLCSSPYGWTKVMNEQILTDAAAANDRLSVVLLRYFNPIGAHESGLIGEAPQDMPNNIMPILTQVSTGELESLTVFGNDYDTPDGTCRRDYIHVMDLAEGHCMAIEYAEGRKGTEIFNLGTGIPYSVLELIHAYEDASGRNIPYTIGSRREGDVADSWADPSKAKECLGWEAKRSLYEMCRDSWNWASGSADIR